MSLCNDCNKRSSCSTLCPGAKLYANQDWINLRELTVGLNPESMRKDIDIQEQELNFATDLFQQKSRKEQVVTLLAAGFSRKKITQVLGITRNNLRIILYRIAKKRYKNG